jgi:homoserine kinase
MSILIRVPATIANLGPGFDCLGLALDLWNELEVTVTGETLQIEIQGEGSQQLPVSAENAIYQAMLTYAKRHSKQLPAGLHLLCTNRIPLGSGLGSSSAAAVAGILAASAVLDLPANIDDQLSCAALIEGHPDNVAPCLYGGLVACIQNGESIIVHKMPVQNFSLILIHPYFDFTTSAARAALPQQISRSDAVFNSSHLLITAEALRTGDPALLRAGMQDRIHEPYRLPLIPGANDAIAAAKEAGAIKVILSGAGPSLLAFSPSSEARPLIAARMQASFSQAGLNSEAIFPQISFTGATSLSK